MKATVLCSNSIASDSHRTQQEEVDIDMNDTIADVKIKITLVYT